MKRLLMAETQSEAETEAIAAELAGERPRKFEVIVGVTSGHVLSTLFVHVI